MRDRLTRDCPVVLTDTEFEAKATELATLERRLQELRADKKASASNFNSQIEEVSASIVEVAGIVERRAEIREVDCFEKINIEKRIVEIYRDDTGELVDTRGITAADIQQALPMTVEPESDNA